MQSVGASHHVPFEGYGLEYIMVTTGWRQIHEELEFYREEFPMIVDDISAMPAGPHHCRGRPFYLKSSTAGIQPASGNMDRTGSGFPEGALCEAHMDPRYSESMR